MRLCSDGGIGSDVIIDREPLSDKTIRAVLSPGTGPTTKCEDVSPRGAQETQRTFTHSFRCGLISFVPPGGTCLPRSRTRN